MGSSTFQKYPPISGEAGGEKRGQPWYVIMACHFSSTFPTMHDPDWSQNTHLGSWHTAQKYITWVRGSTSIMITETRRACICVCMVYSLQHHGWEFKTGASSVACSQKEAERGCRASPIHLHVCMFFLYFYSYHQDAFLERKSSTRALELRALWERMAAPYRPPHPESPLSPLLKLDPRSNQRQLGVVGGN